MNTRRTKRFPNTTALASSASFQPRALNEPQHTPEVKSIPRPKAIALPSQFDNILVEFEMPGSEIIWWRALIEDIDYNTSEDGILAIATVVYDDGHDKQGHYYPAETGQVHFLSNHTLLSTSNSKTFAKGLLLHWKYEDVTDVPVNDEP